MVSEIERRLRVDDRVIRYLVVRVDEAYRVAERLTSRRSRDRARRRQARGLPPEVAKIESRSDHESPKINEESKTETPVEEANNG